jgi:hypothetical protein
LGSWGSCGSTKTGILKKKRHTGTLTFIQKLITVSDSSQSSKLITKLQGMCLTCVWGTDIKPAHCLVLSQLEQKQLYHSHVFASSHKLPLCWRCPPVFHPQLAHPAVVAACSQSSH